MKEAQMAFPELFDTTKALGPASDRRVQFSAVDDLLRYMDRLGIARALVYLDEARTFHPALGNRWLLERLVDAQAACGRLFPAAVVAPDLRYDRSGLSELKAALAAGTLRALRYFVGGQWDLAFLEPVMAELMPWQPVLFLDAQAMPSYREIVGFAETFPALPMVALQGMWGAEYQLLDLLERCPNFHIDTSWMHSDETLEYVVETFGAHRILFGAGPDAFNGAAIAALAHARVSAEDRAAIAGGNLARLLGLDELPPTGITPLASPNPEKSLWNLFLRGAPLAVDIVDAHAHPTATGSWFRVEREPDAFAARARHEMARLGIDTLCQAGVRACLGDSLADHETNERLYSDGSGQFYGYVACNPFLIDDLRQRFDDYFSRDYYIGFKLLNDYWRVPVTDPRFKPVWDYANAHRLPILLHTWMGSCDDPAMLRDIASVYPEATFILGHSGGSDHGSAVALAEANPNVYLEWCGTFCSQQRWEEIVARVGAGRILYGSDFVTHNMSWELGRLLSLDLPDEQLVPILGGNMRRILARRRRG